MRSTAHLLLLCLCPLLAGPVIAEVDEEYRAAFLKAFPLVEPQPGWADYATQDRFDTLYLQAGWESALHEVNNDAGGIAWGTSYLMMAFNGMFEATGDVKYLEANHATILAVLAATDARRGKTLSDGRTVAAWGCEVYSNAGRAVHAVHTGIIAAPIFDFLRLARTHAAYHAKLGSEFDAIAQAGLAALAVHEDLWREGPEPSAGHYLASPFEDGDGVRALPGNWQSAMGWAWYRAGQALQAPVHRDRAVRLGQYLRNRLCLGSDGAYYWPYQLPEAAVTIPCERTAVDAEDTSHAGLSMALPFALGADGLVFTEEDLTRLAHTVVRGFAPAADGILYPRINGATGLDPASYISFPARWIWLARYVPAVEERLKLFYLRHRATPAPLEIADLLRHARGR